MTAYTYTLAGAIDSETYPSGRVVKNVLDASGDLSKVESARCGSTHGVSASCTDQQGFWSYAKNLTFNAAGAVTSMQLGNGKWESTVFNSRLQPTQIALGTVQNGYDKLKLNYTYNTTGNADNNGNIQSQTITVPTVGANTGFVAVQNYNYDSLNRLKDATENVTPNGGLASQSWKQAFTFDRYGNRNFDEANTTTLPKNCGTSPNFVVCTADRNIYNPGINGDGKNRLNASNGYGFDNAGNTADDAQGRTFVYDAENKQISVSDPNGTIGQYFYDGDGKRVKKYVPSTGEVTIFVYDAAGKEIAEYSTIVAASQDAKVNYLTADHLGSPRINTDQNGNIIARHDYIPFGEEIDGTGGRTTGLNYGDDSVRKQFTRYELDSESELDYAQARYYNSTHGRFTSVDPITASEDIINPQSFNRYAYVGNNPLNFTDPTGEMWGVSGTSIQWFDTKDAMRKAGFTAYSALVAVIAGTNQMVALNPNAKSYVQVAGATAAIEQLAGWGAFAEAIAASGAVTGIGAGAAIAIAMAYVETYLPENFVIDNRPEQVMGYSMSKRQREYFEQLANQMSKIKGNEANPSAASGESTPADPNASKPNPEDNKPSASSSKPPGHDKDWVKLRGSQGYRDPEGNIWKKDMLHRDHWDVSDRKGNKIKEVDFNGKQIWPGGPKNKNK
jgi:RHS repeat-associated protein